MRATRMWELKLTEAGAVYDVETIKVSERVAILVKNVM